jgi:hypothetical protein
MGKDARKKRERRGKLSSRPSGPEWPEPPIDTVPTTGQIIVTGPPLPGFEHAVADDGYFDDCPVCQALRAGDPELALQRMRESPTFMDLRDPDDRN